LHRAIVLLSGGIDSATALYLIKPETDEIYTLNMVYTQSYDSEAEASKRLAAAAQVKEHLVIYLPFYKDLEKRYHPPPSNEVTTAYVPARNIVFYGIAAAYAETLGAHKVVFGSNSDDATELPDARPEFVQLMNKVIRAGTRTGYEGGEIAIVNPLMRYDKNEVLRLALKLNVPLELTWSCYEDAPIPCGKCRGCLTRQKAFHDVGAEDPLRYTHRNQTVHHN
jgi:7-cyano-7-deazaguanine synthase